MTAFPLPSDEALNILAKLSARPSRSERLAQMQIDAQVAAQTKADNLARFESLTMQMTESRDRARAGKQRETERAEDREQAFEMLQRRQEFAREETRTEQAFKLQQAGQRLRGAGMRPGGPRPSGPRPSTTQRAVMTGPAGMLASRGGGPVEQIEGFGEQLTAAQELGQEARFMGPELRPRLVQEGHPAFSRVSPSAMADPLMSIITDSSMSEPDKLEMARAMGSIGQKGGLTMNQFLEQIEDREPVRLTADEYRVKRDRVVTALARIENRNSPEAQMLLDSIDYYETKMMERRPTRFNPAAFRTVDEGPVAGPSSQDIDALLDQGYDDETIARLLRGQ